MDGMIRKEQLIAARHFAVYYGLKQAEMLSEFDVVIVEPLGMRDEDLATLRKQNTLVIAYLSVMEVHPDHPAFKRLQHSDFLIVNQTVMKNETWGTWLVDPRSPRWHNILQEQAEELLEQRGFDGLFLDTIGDVEHPDIPELLRISLLHELVTFVQELKERYTERILIQNNGLGRLLQSTAPFIDAVCWENPVFADKHIVEWTKRLTEKLAAAQKKCGIRVLLLLEESADIHYRKAQKIAGCYGFLLYRAPNHYVSGVGTAESISRRRSFIFF